MIDLIEATRAALGRPGQPSSDFDLNREVTLPASRKLRPAGVLAAIGQGRHGPHLYLTKRSSALKHHPGQIAFPGGKQDESDRDVTHTALREAQEEIGLPMENVELLGTLPPHETVTGFLVTPVIALVRDEFPVCAEPGEVEEVFHVPLNHVLRVENYLVESRIWRGMARRYFVVPYGPYYIWGATARMLRAWTNQISS